MVICNCNAIKMCVLKVVKKLTAKLFSKMIELEIELFNYFDLSRCVTVLILSEMIFIALFNLF